MLCLGIDTTGPWCSVALVDEARILAVRRQNIGTANNNPDNNKKGHAERLADMVQDVLRTADVQASDLDKISVCTGPGSFTGPRIGLAFAKGLALPHNIPLVGLPALHVWAAIADPERCKTVLSVADVKRGQVCAQVFNNGTATHRPKTLENDAIKLQAQMVTGSGAYFLGGEITNSYVCPARLAWLGLDLCPSTHPAEPLYHRPPDAKLPGGRVLQKT
ncbi:MAG: tRNA (adenosine(37)-N6)-threonylcarbamoyltransferase complex dimerization subunit type 1 TsaB [Robiginitomaculum sp.]|nr:MAG: tRNA (adenosine(37)-N6)-threonylcarbamoyltransferase complex dimerization subunit type 1 TsaB [Robiginitomaculum sp.]